jgi:hypothetical protein
MPVLQVLAACLSATALDQHVICNSLFTGVLAPCTPSANRVPGHLEPASKPRRGVIASEGLELSSDNINCVFLDVQLVYSPDCNRGWV